MESSLLTAITNFLLSNGLSGIVIIGLSFWIVRQANERNKADVDRLAEAKKANEIGTTALTTVASWVPVNADRNRILENIVEALKLQTASFENLERTINTAMESLERHIVNGVEQQNRSLDRVEAVAKAAAESHRQLREAVLASIRSTGRNGQP